MDNECYTAIDHSSTRRGREGWTGGGVRSLFGIRIPNFCMHVCVNHPPLALRRGLSRAHARRQIDSLVSLVASFRFVPRTSPSSLSIVSPP